jgi:hypothetical protein
MVAIHQGWRGVAAGQRRHPHDRPRRPIAKDGERQPAWCDAARQPGLSAGGSHGPVANSWRSAASLSSPHLAAVDR